MTDEKITNIGFVFTCSGREDLLREALKRSPIGSYYKTGRDVRIHAIAVLDGDWDPTDEFVKYVSSFAKVLLTGEELGISKSWNIGIKHCLERGYDYVGIFNDDIEFPSLFTGRVADILIPLLQQGKKCVCFPDRLTLSSLRPDLVPSDDQWGSKPWPMGTVIDVSNFNHLSPYPGGLSSFCVGVEEQTAQDPWAPCSMNGSAFILSREAIEKVGLFSEDFVWPGCYEDVDYWLRLLETYGPYEIGTALPMFIHHWRSATVGNLDRARSQAGVDYNAMIFKKKWTAKQELVDWFQKVNAMPVGSTWPKCPIALPGMK